MCQVKIFKFLVWNHCPLDLGDICRFKKIFWTVCNSFLNSTGTMLSSKTTTFSRDWLCSRSCCSRPSSDCSLSSISTFHKAFFLSLSAFNWSRKSWKFKNQRLKPNFFEEAFFHASIFLTEQLQISQEHLKNKSKKNWLLSLSIYLFLSFILLATQ